MRMMRQLKSIASGRSSVSDPGGDSGSERPKFEQDGAGDIVIEPHLKDDKPMRIDQELSSSSNRDAEASTSTSMEPVQTEEPGTDLPKEMNDMTISDDKADGHNDKKIEGVTLDGNGTEKGQIIATTIGGHNGEAKAGYVNRATFVRRTLLNLMCGGHYITKPHVRRTLH